MALTRNSGTRGGAGQARLAVREALFTEALNAYYAGDTTAGKAILRDLVNATVGFEA